MGEDVKKFVTRTTCQGELWITKLNSSALRCSVPTQQDCYHHLLWHRSFLPHYTEKSAQQLPSSTCTLTQLRGARNPQRSHCEDAQGAAPVHGARSQQHTQELWPEGAAEGEHSLQTTGSSRTAPHRTQRTFHLITSRQHKQEALSTVWERIPHQHRWLTAGMWPLNTATAQNKAAIISVNPTDLHKHVCGEAQNGTCLLQKWKSRKQASHIFTREQCR